MAEALTITIKQGDLGWWEAKDATGLLRNYGPTPEEALSGLTRSWRAMWPQEPDRLPCPEGRPVGVEGKTNG